MMRPGSKQVIALAAVMLLTVPFISLAADSISRPDQLQWTDGPFSLPAGVKSAVLEGDPTKEGPFTLRLKFPDGYRIPPHWHSSPERVTVISGTFNLGQGEKADILKGMELPSGSFFLMDPKSAHYAWATGETVVQINGTGPWGINYVNPADDPRKK
ncbi:hypothetical protein BAC1_01320 [uncultured bacterium]|nr:hypothetical protein BAC1_01320 [uncultured bacterium]